MAESCDKNQKHPVLAVVGPTATGKTALGVALAEAFEGEVISADSMQIYKGLDVGTAKVAPEETHGIPHHAVDILEPDEPFSVADFVTLAGTLEADISARGRLPILVGGTGLYVQSFLYGVRFAAEKTPDGLREQLAAESWPKKARRPCTKSCRLPTRKPPPPSIRTIRCGSCGRWNISAPPASV
ncbi:MAG: isopentenyl transferase family protein [Faecalibacterium prausnitzii]